MIYHTRRILSAVIVGATAAALALIPTAAVAAPANDSFANAKVITGSNGTINGTAVGATMEAGEREHDNYWNDDPAGTDHSVWYSWVAPATGLVEFATDSHAVDIYTGSSLTTLENDESECDPDWYDDVCLVSHVVTGTVYHIAVDGFEAPFDLSWRLFPPPTNDMFADAIVLPGLGSSFPEIERTVGYATTEPSEPPHGAGAVPSHSVWYRWTAQWNSKVTVSAQVGGVGRNQCFYDATDIAVYRGTSLTALSFVHSAHTSLSDGVGCLSPSLTFRANRGTTYSIAVNAVEGYAPLIGGLQAKPVCDYSGTTGNDTVTGGAGNDVLCGLGGDDKLRGAGGDDYLVGGPGIDAADYAASATGVAANLTTKTATGEGTDALEDLENLIGSPFADKLDGDGDTNVLNGGGGGDSLWGQAGDDSLVGHAGDDTVGGGLGNDRLNGGTGVDVVHYGAAPAVIANLTTGSATGEGTDILSLIESIIGSPGADKLTGSTAANVLGGAGGNDTVLGGGGNDALTGAGGLDALAGGAGTDRCDGGADRDTASTCETLIGIS